MSNSLKRYLERAYGQEAINRCPKSEQRIFVDDQDQIGVYRNFFRISVLAASDVFFVLFLQYAPADDNALELVQVAKGKIMDHKICKELQLDLTAFDSPFIRRLAKAIRHVQGPGDRRQQREWANMCRRTAKSLDKFATHLKTCERMLRAEAIPAP